MLENRLLLDILPWAPRPLIVLGLVVLSIVAAIAVHKALWALFKRFFSASYPFVNLIVIRTQAISRFAFVMVAFSAVVPLAPFSANVVDIVHRVLLAAFIVFVGWLAAVAANLAIDRYIGRFKIDTADNLLARKAVTQMRVLKRILDTVLIVLTIAFALMSFDSVRHLASAFSPPRALLVSLSALPRDRSWRICWLAFNLRLPSRSAWATF
jgi:hypothetical protein